MIQFKAAKCMEPGCDEGAVKISENYQKFYCDIHLLVQTDADSFTHFEDMEPKLDDELRLLEKTFANLSIYLSYVTGLYHADELSGIDAEEFDKFETAISEELIKVHEGVFQVGNIEHGNNPMLSTFVDVYFYTFTTISSRVTKSLGIRNQINKMVKCMNEASKLIAQYYFAMTLKQLGNQVHRMQTQDPSTNIDNFDHKLDIFDKKFEIEMQITPKDTIKDLLEDLQKKDEELQVAHEKIAEMTAQKEIDDKKANDNIALLQKINGTCQLYFN